MLLRRCSNLLQNKRVTKERINLVAMLIRTFLILSLIVLLFATCEDDVPEPVVVDYRPVTVVWAGSRELDGCGFFVYVDSVQYKATNEGRLDTLFREAFEDNRSDNDTVVEMRYRDLRREIDAYCWVLQKERGLEVLDVR